MHEVTKGLLGQIQNLQFTTVLSVRQARSDERVASSGQEFAFYHSFERPTRTKWWKGCSATGQICIWPQFWASDTHEVMKGSLGQVKNLHFTTVLSVGHARSHERVVKSTGAIPAPRQKKNVLRLFQSILISSLCLQSFLVLFFSSLWRFAIFSLVFSLVFKDSHHFSRTLGSVWTQSLKTAITSAELWAVFEHSL